MDMFEFAKLGSRKKEELLHTKAMLLESYADKNKRKTVYYLPSFFVEVTTSLEKNKVVDIIPYRRGYKVEKEKNALYENFRITHLLVA